MKNFFTALLMLLIRFPGWSQPSTDAAAGSNLADEVARLKEIIKGLQENEIQSEKIKYLRNYQLVLYGIEIIKEIKQGTVEISSARSQNILYKKIIDINNPSSDALGFQLMEVIDKTLEDNINALPLVDG